MKHELLLFTDRLRMHLAQLDPADVVLLREKSVAHRADMLFELGADLSDAVELFGHGRVNDTTVREAAVSVAVEAVKVWLSTTYMERDGDGD